MKKRVLVSCFLLSINFTALAAQPRQEPIQPVPDVIELDQQKVSLGDELFHDTRLSKDNSLSCASCHSLATAGVDNQPRSIGINGAKGNVNAPTVLNSGFNFVQFWDGRAASLEEQAAGPVLNPVEMGANWDEVLAQLQADPHYVAVFQEIYGDDIKPEYIQNAIATFEQSLITPNSPFDRYLNGDDAALSDEAMTGYALFKSVGCIACHNGVNVGGNSYQKFGLVKDYFSMRGNITEADYGRFNVTGNVADKFMFKVPGLRNVELTAPYFHDASAETLEDAVTIMAEYQLGKQLTPAEVKAIVSFLKSLTAPNLPQSKVANS